MSEHRYDQFIEQFRCELHERDAREWMEDRRAKPRLIYGFDESVTRDIVDSVYACGANDVRVLGNEEAIVGDESIDMLLIVLPSDKTSRVRLFEFSAQVAKESGLEGDIDEGQRYMLLRWT